MNKSTSQKFPDETSIEKLNDLVDKEFTQKIKRIPKYYLFRNEKNYFPSSFDKEQFHSRKGNLINVIKTDWNHQIHRLSQPDYINSFIDINSLQWLNNIKESTQFINFSQAELS